MNGLYRKLWVEPMVYYIHCKVNDPSYCLKQDLEMFED